MYCKKCGRELEDGSLYCDICGVAQLDKLAAPRRERERRPAKPKRSMALLASALIGTAYVIYILWYCATTMSASVTDSEIIGTGIAITLTIPHMILCALALLFNWLGFATRSRGLALTGAILYCVAALLMVLWAAFVLPEIVLSFVGFARMKMRKKDDVDMDYD